MRPTDALWPPAGPRSVVVQVRGTAGPSARAALCTQVRRLLCRGDVDVVTCDLTQVLVPDIGAIDALARLQLTARRLGGHIRVRAANAELRGLLRLAGVAEVVGCSDEVDGSGC